jgi:hypothetical protein
MISMSPLGSRRAAPSNLFARRKRAPKLISDQASGKKDDMNIMIAR